MKKRQNFLLPICFFLFLALMLLLFFLLPRQDYSEKEKRYLAEAPRFTLSQTVDGSFQQDVERWLSDHFPLRDLWVGIDAYLNLAEGRNAQRDVYYAREQHLVRSPAALDREKLGRNLQRFDQFAASTGLPARLLIVPSPGSVNEALLPRGHGAYADDAVFDAAAALENVALLDPRQALTEANQVREAYYRTDHHLTAFGSYTLYTLWRQQHGLSAVPPSAYAISEYSGFYGTAWSAGGYWLVPPDTLELWDRGIQATVTVSDGSGATETHEGLFFTEHLSELDKYPVYLDGNHPLVEIRNPSAEGGTLLVIKDSYAHCFSTFLAADYQEIYLIDLRYYRGSVSDFAREQGADELLYLYGVENLLTDTNSAWLF